MPKLPTNMIRRKGRPGYWFRGKHNGKLTHVGLGADYKQACERQPAAFFEKLRNELSGLSWPRKGPLELAHQCG